MDIPATQTSSNKVSAGIRGLLLPRLLVPREHGAWAMLLVPAIVGLAVGPLGGLPERSGGWSFKIPLYLGAVLSLFLARYPLFLLSRSSAGRLPQGWLFSLAVTTALSIVLAAPLALSYGLWWLLAFGALAASMLPLHLYLVRVRRDRTIAGEFLGVVALSVTAPAGYYVASGSLSALGGWLLWFLCAAFFGSSIFYVKMKVEYPARRRRSTLASKLPFVVPLWAYHGAVLATVVALGFLGAAPAWTVLAYVPIALQAVAGSFNPSMDSGQRPSLKKLGLMQLGHSVVFAALLIAVFRLSGP